jgi:regulator of cell morphogenesis and NO signaling
MTRSLLETTPIGEIVQRDNRAAAIMDRYHLDYCCGGAVSLAEGCRERGISVDRVVADIEALNQKASEPVPDDPVALIAHIVGRHHAYVRQSLPLIQEHLAKVVGTHAARHAELPLIESEFSTIANELSQHLVKEEQVLFLYIRSLADAVNHNGPRPPDIFGTVQNPIRMMEVEHQEADDRMAVIRELSHNYAAPTDACTTYRLVLKELEAFELDLHTHVDLENSVLFPKAVELEEKAELMARGLKSQQWG